MKKPSVFARSLMTYSGSSVIAIVPAIGWLHHEDPKHQLLRGQFGF